jgi:AcrR family transcriptional regulator
VVAGGLGLAFRAGQCGELPEQAGLLEGDLPGVGVQVERAPGIPGADRRVGVVDGDVDAAPLQDPGAQEPGWARAEILRVALELFTEKGYEATSTRDVTSALGITKSALYYHFRSKDEIVTTLMSERRAEVDDLAEWIAAQPSSPDLLARAVRRWIESTTPQRLQMMRLAHANQPTLRRLVGGNDVRAAFDKVIDLLVLRGASAEDRLLARMAFDAASAALLAAQGTDATLDEVLAVAWRVGPALAALAR